MDQLGIGISIYFKLLKSMICLLLVSFVICIPIMTIYASDPLSNQGSLQKYVSATFLGNLGEYSHRCMKLDINHLQKDEDHTFEL